MIIRIPRISYTVPATAIKNIDDDGRPLRADELASQILTRTSNWPRRIGDQLWVIDGPPHQRQPRPLCPVGLRAWLGYVLNVVIYMRPGPGHITRGQLLRAIRPYCQSITMDELQQIAAVQQVQPDQTGGGL